MDEIIKAVISDDFVVFNEKFKDKLKDAYLDKTSEIKKELSKTLFTEMAVNDGSKTIKCKNCGKKIVPGVPVMGSCPYCGSLLT
jgi:DNA-directed RNA polymerase subunit RPC12/RpoP